MTAYRHRKATHGSKKRQYANTRINPTPQAERIDQLLDASRTHKHRWKDSPWPGQERCNCGDYRKKEEQQPCE